MASSFCEGPTNALTRAWVKRRADQPSVSWQVVAAAGNVGKGIVGRVQAAISSLALRPLAPRRRITGKRPAPAEWLDG